MSLLLTPERETDVMDVLISLIVMVIPQYIHTSKHCVLQPECVQLLFVNCVSIELGEKIIGRPWDSRETWDLLPILKEFISSYVRSLYSLESDCMCFTWSGCSKVQSQQTGWQHP